MGKRVFSKIMVIVLLCSPIAFADRSLERTELLQIFQQLTAQPHRTWIPAGTIEATHEEYSAAAVTDENEINRQITSEIQRYRNDTNKHELTEALQKMKLDSIPFNIRHDLSNEYTMNTKVLVKFDGKRFYWEINVDSRSDSVKPGKDLAGNNMTQEFDLNANTRRIFAWDGEKYTTYFLPSNNAVVNAGPDASQPVNGPLTAGIVPWGYGRYTYDNLCATESSGIETSVDGATQIVLTLKNTDRSQSRFTLNPAKNYALTNCLIEQPDGSTISRQYSDYTFAAGGWIPKTILLEQFDAGSGRLKARDLWNITSIDENIPQAAAFDVIFVQDALIEHHSAEITAKTVYRHSNTTDTKKLLAKRLAIAKDGANKRNCATAAIGYVASEFGVTISDGDLASLVNQTTGDTSLSDMKHFLQGNGFYCRAVNTNIDTLKKLTGCKAILHLPSKKHFVVMDHIDDRYIWLTDLSSAKLYDHTELSFFDMDWPNGTALLVSKQSIPGDFNEISNSQLSEITGGEEGYSCTQLLQERRNVSTCSMVDGAYCTGKLYVYLQHHGCEVAGSGSCYISRYPRFLTSPCIVNPAYPDMCDITGEFTYYYMMACD